jgi:hypothetical protein
VKLKLEMEIFSSWGGTVIHFLFGICKTFIMAVSLLSCSFNRRVSFAFKAHISSHTGGGRLLREEAIQIGKHRMVVVHGTQSLHAAFAALSQTSSLQ